LADGYGGAFTREIRPGVATTILSFPEEPSPFNGARNLERRVFQRCRLGEQCRCRIVLEQRQMRFDIFRAPKPWGIHQGRSSGPIPSEPATARMSTTPSGESRVSPLASSAFCAPASSPSLNCCAAMPSERTAAESFASGPCSRVIQKRATSAAIGTQAAPASPSAGRPATSRPSQPAQAGCVRPLAPCRRQERACKNPKVGNLKSRRFDVPIPAARQSPRW
jgi:hypothetical protein